ncbi:hypothetical protein [Streptomyces sp. NPDC087270]
MSGYFSGSSASHAFATLSWNVARSMSGPNVRALAVFAAFRPAAPRM